MNTQKVAITIPKDLIAVIDTMSRQNGVSRSKFITQVLREKILSEKDRQLKEAYNQVFSDNSIKEEQLDTSAWFDGAEVKEGQEW